MLDQLFEHFQVGPENCLKRINGWPTRCSIDHHALNSTAFFKTAE